MANCVYSDVRKIINTSLEDSEITEIITLADAEITGRNMDSRSANILKLISMFITASIIACRDPTSKSVGYYRETLLTPLQWRQLAEKQIQRTGDAPIVFANDPLPWE